MKKMVLLRRCSQIIFLIFFIYLLWSTTYPLRGRISPQVLFKVDPLIILLTALSQRVVIGGLFFSLIMIFLTLIFGRFFCGWMCPLGTMIDIFAFFSNKKTPNQLSRKTNLRIRKIKYVILAIMLVFALIGVQAGWIFDPIVTIGRVVSLSLIPAFTSMIDNAFIFLIKKFSLYGGFYDFYRNLKSTLLGVNVHFFYNSLPTFIFFLIICSAGFFITRLWCRMLCPLGAFYAWIAKKSFLSRYVDKCISCGLCAKSCRMGAIREDAFYDKSECILCMDCIYDCPTKETYFPFRGKKEKNTRAKENQNQPLSRKNFLFLLLSAFSFFVFAARRKKSLIQRKTTIRPPGVNDEDKFLNTCVRCGNCMKVCITNGLQPTTLESGLQGVWTPKLVPEIGYCEYNCTLCGEVCPTQAIPKLPLEKKKASKLGVAKVSENICIAWANKEECIVCEEHCPVPTKAIKRVEETVNGRTIYKPVVDEDLCIGCGICQNKCPVRPIRAIRVRPIQRNDSKK